MRTRRNSAAGQRLTHLEEVEEGWDAHLERFEELPKNFVLHQVHHPTDAALDRDEHNARAQLEHFLHQHHRRLEVHLSVRRLATGLGVPRNEVHDHVLQCQHPQDHNLRRSQNRASGSVSGEVEWAVRCAGSASACARDASIAGAPVPSSSGGRTASMAVPGEAAPRPLPPPRLVRYAALLGAYLCL